MEGCVSEQNVVVPLDLCAYHMIQCCSETVVQRDE